MKYENYIDAPNKTNKHIGEFTGIKKPKNKGNVLKINLLKEPNLNKLVIEDAIEIGNIIQEFVNITGLPPYKMMDESVLTSAEKQFPISIVKLEMLGDIVDNFKHIPKWKTQLNMIMYMLFLNTRPFSDILEVYTKMQNGEIPTQIIDGIKINEEKYKKEKAEKDKKVKP